MTSTVPTLHLLCGKIASGKSTLSAQLARQPKTIVLSEDDWLKTLFGDQMKTPKDFVRCSKTLRAAMGAHIVALLSQGVTVVLDFQANTVESRAWMRSLLDQTQAAHQLHYLDTPDSLCLKRLEVRNQAGDHAFAATKEQFEMFSKAFVPPAEAEGFSIVVHRPDEASFPSA